MKHLLLLLAIAISLSSPYAYACSNDFECGYGNQCRRAAGEYGPGMCVKLVDQFGSSTFQTQSVEPAQVKGCYGDYECGMGRACVKRSGQVKGICILD